MANYNQVSYGSKGDDVLQLQKKLNKNGYKLDEDGIFGNNTKAAVEDYQQKNNLEVNGIVGDQTWMSIDSMYTGTPTTATETASRIETADDPNSFAYNPYKPSDTVAQAEALLQQQLDNKPGEYTSTWSDQLNETIAQILNRDKFSYDLNADALYQQYKDQYMMLGQQASMDAMGQAAALTGGYGNSYAQGVGQQAYQSYLQRLNDVVPELYGMARDQYNQEGQALYDRASLMASMEDQEYGRYRDSLSDYYTELSRLTEDARYKGEQDYGRWADRVNLEYGMHRDQIGDQQWQAEFDEAKRRYDQEWELQNSKNTTQKPGNPNPDPGDGGEKCPKCGKLKSQCVCEKDGDTSLTGFNGTTYSEAVAYANEHGVPNSRSSSILTQSEYNRVKRSGGTRDHANEFDTYQQYLQWAVDSMINAYSSSGGGASGLNGTTNKLN